MAKQPPHPTPPHPPVSSARRKLYRPAQGHRRQVRQKRASKIFSKSAPALCYCSCRFLMFQRKNCRRQSQAELGVPASFHTNLRGTGSPLSPGGGGKGRRNMDPSAGPGAGHNAMGSGAASGRGTTNRAGRARRGLGAATRSPQAAGGARLKG